MTKLLIQNPSTPDAIIDSVVSDSTTSPETRREIAVVVVNPPSIVQKASNVSSGSVGSLAKAFASANVLGNSIVVVCAVGSSVQPSVSDSAGNIYTIANAALTPGSAVQLVIFYATNIFAGANTVTVTNNGAAASIAMEIYEVAGFVGQVSSKLDQTAVNSGTGTTASTASLTPSVPNVYAFAGVAIGTAAQTITPINTGAINNWINDSGQLNPTTPAGLFSFISMSELLDSLDLRTASATILASEPWAMVVAAFRPIAFPVMASVNLDLLGGVSVVTGGTPGSQGVGGLAADAAAPVGNPNLVAGYDSVAAVVRRISVGSAGGIATVDDATAVRDSRQEMQVISRYQEKILESILAQMKVNNLLLLEIASLAGVQIRTEDLASELFQEGSI